MNSFTIYSESPGGCRKRKRENCGTKLDTQKEAKPILHHLNGILNPGFILSTPHKDFTKTTIRRSSKRIQSVALNKENIQKDSINLKSVSELASTNKTEGSKSFEIVRKPPKKKKKPDIEESCFENPALNLNAPERILNPFEIRRLKLCKEMTEVKNSCFINNGLDIRIEDSNLNPYEITRPKTPVESATKGITNLALDVSSPKSILLSKNISIALPFQPTTHCRIDFQKIPLESLLAKKVNTSVGTNTNNSDDLLPAITEDEEIDIGKELDSYQLELENSINEAKLKRNNIEVEKQIVFKNATLVGSVFENTSIQENDAGKCSDISGKSKLFERKYSIGTRYDKNYFETESMPIGSEESTSKILNNIADHILTPEVEKTKANEFEGKCLYNGTKEFSVSDAELEEPTQFVRCYRKSALSSTQKRINNIENIEKMNINEEKSKIGTSIRRSFRNLITHCNERSGNDKSTKLQQNNETTGQNRLNQNIFQSIRQSLRRKHSNEINEHSKFSKQNEISIIDITERTKIFRSPKVKDQVKNMQIEKLKGILTKNKYSL